MQAGDICGTNSVAQGKQVCHCEGALRPWQSRSTRSDNRKASGEYGSVTQRGVEDAAPYKACAVDIVHGNLQLPKALTERRYRRNRLVRFIVALYELQLPSRDCHVGRWPPRNDNSKPLHFRRCCPITYQPARRSLSAATDAIGWYVFVDSLFVSPVGRREGHAPPLQRVADARIIQQKQGRTGLGASLSFQLLIPPPAWACRGACTWSSSRRGGCSHSRCSGTGGRRAACAARRPCTLGRSRAARRPS